MKAGGSRRRLLAGSVAMLGVSLLASPSAPALATQTTRPVEFMVTKGLRDGEVAEWATVQIQGTTIGALAVDRRTLSRHAA